jgi:hypothetical protein
MNTVSPEAFYQHPVNYSAFEINMGTHLCQTYGNCAPANGMGALPQSPQCLTMFGVCGDDGRAMLREPGAFLAPNHFHSANDGITYSNVGSYLGANLIIPKMVSDLLLRRSMPRGLNAQTPIMAETFLFDMILNMAALPDAAVNELFTILKASWDRNYAAPLAAREAVMVQNADARARAAAGGPPFVAMVVPPEPAFTRLNLTDTFFDTAAPTRMNNLDSWLQYWTNTTRHASDHAYRDVIWLWDHVRDTADEIWAERGGASDYRLLERVGPGAAGVQPIAAAATFTARFPQFQPGIDALKDWHANLSDYETLAGAVAPLGPLLSNHIVPPAAPGPNHVTDWNAQLP